MKKNIIITFTIALILFAPSTLCAEAINLDDAISQLENTKSNEPSEDEKARSYMLKTIKSSKNINEKISLSLVSYLSFEHKFLYGYPSFCQKEEVNLARFKEIYKTANNDIRQKVEGIMKNSPDFKKISSELFNNKKALDTESSSIRDEFKDVEISGFSKGEMCDIFNTKSPKDMDINYKTLFKEIASDILNYDENVPLIIK